MTWLMVQVIAWCFIGFAVGAALAWLLGMLLWPHEDYVDAEGYYRDELPR